MIALTQLFLSKKVFNPWPLLACIFCQALVQFCTLNMKEALLILLGVFLSEVHGHGKYSRKNTVKLKLSNIN